MSGGGPAFSSGFMRALSGQYSIGVRHGHTSLADAPDPSRQIHTAVYEADKHKMHLLEPMTEYEARLFRRAGFKEVVDYRRWLAKEQGITDWREIGKTRYAIRPQEPGAVQEGRPEDQPQGTTTGSEDPKADVRIQVLPVSDGVRGDQGATEEKRSPGSNQANGAGAEDRTGEDRRSQDRTLRQGMQETRSLVERARAKAGEQRPTPENPETLSRMQGVAGSGGAQGVEAEIPAKGKRVGGRPKKYASDRDKWRENKRQAKAKKRGRVA